MSGLLERAADTVGIQCVDITFADPKDVAEVTPENCANTTNIALNYVYATAGETSDAEILLPSKVAWMASIPLAVTFILGLL